MCTDYYNQTHGTKKVSLYQRILRLSYLVFDQRRNHQPYWLHSQLLLGQQLIALIADQKSTWPRRCTLVVLRVVENDGKCAPVDHYRVYPL